MNNKWLIKGVVLGLAFFLAVLLVKPIGVSTQFVILDGIIYNAIDPDVITEDENSPTGYTSTNAYYAKSDGKYAKAIENPLNYSFVFVLAIPLGAYLASKLKSKKVIEDEVEKDINSNDLEVLKGSGESFIKKYGPSFVSGVLLLFGSRMAGGCTSGHMMSGIMQSSVSGFVFTIAVFATAVPAAIILPKMIFKKGAKA